MRNGVVSVEWGASAKIDIHDDASTDFPAIIICPAIFLFAISVRRKSATTWLRGFVRQKAALISRLPDALPVITGLLSSSFELTSMIPQAMPHTMSNPSDLCEQEFEASKRSTVPGVVSVIDRFHGNTRERDGQCKGYGRKSEPF